MRLPYAVTCVSIIILAVCHGIDRDPEETLHYFANLSEERGNVFYQAKLDGVDYRALLTGALAKDEKSLMALFKYTVKGNLMGEGADTHEAILQALLYYYGDREYSKVLGHLSQSIRRQVIANLDERFGLESYSKRFPRTYALAPHKKST
jgi:hypothetical protein